MKIVRLTGVNYLILKAIEIKPDGNAVLITGKNGNGKSAVLSLIVSILCGKKYMPAEPVRKGEDFGEGVIETENYIIKRTFDTEGGSKLTIRNADGEQPSSPQKLLDKIVGEIAFDPMEFIYMGDTESGRRDQRTMLMKLAGLDFTDIDAKVAKLKSDRSDIRRDKERFEGDAERIEYPTDTPNEEVSMEDLTAKLEEDETHNNAQTNITIKIEGKDTLIEQVAQMIKHHDLTLERLEKERHEAKEQRAVAMSDLNAFKKSRDALEAGIEDLIDVDVIITAMNERDADNVNVRKKIQRRELVKSASAKAEEYQKLGKEVKELEKDKAIRLAKVKMPVEGLSVTDDHVLFFDKRANSYVPLSQVNDAKKLEIGMGIAMAENPELRVILMKGNDLDTDSLEVISKMAAEKDYVVWIERIEGEGGIVIEDGSIVKAKE